MKSRLERFTITVLSSVAHGGNHLGTYSYLRRERFLTPSGSEEIPVVSGNALRGVMRDVGAKMTWEAMDSPSMAVGTADVLWSGGSLVKAKGEPVTGSRLARIRELYPHVGIFGAAGGGRLIEGALSVGKLIPICLETRDFLPDEHADLAQHSIFDLVQCEEYSRQPGRDLLHGAAEMGEETASEGTFRFGVETFIAGTQFSTWWSLRNATETEHLFFDTLVDEYRGDAYVGGRSHVGHGRIRLNTRIQRPTDPWHKALDNTDPFEALRTLQWLG